MDTLKLIGRNKHLFQQDIEDNIPTIERLISENRFLIIGAAGSLGQAVTKEIFKRNPLTLHLVDISENNLVEIVRDIRSRWGYMNGNFKTFALDCGTQIFKKFFYESGPYDYILNLSAMKHVRSEKDPYTLMRMIEVNILNTIETVRLAKETGAKKYFCVSTDKATSPVNMMGASKRIMEIFLSKEAANIDVSTARFANVAFSDGSLLNGFQHRISKMQPIVAPTDIQRYFITQKEAGQLCLLACLLGQNRDIFFPRSKALKLTHLSSLAKNFLKEVGYEWVVCKSEEEARRKSNNIKKGDKWPCYLFKSDTTGEKLIEEFYDKNALVDETSFKNIGIMQNDNVRNDLILQNFNETLSQIRRRDLWKKHDIINLFKIILPDFEHKEMGRDLDQKM